MAKEEEAAVLEGLSLDQIQADAPDVYEELLEAAIESMINGNSVAFRALLAREAVKVASGMAARVGRRLIRIVRPTVANGMAVDEGDEVWATESAARALIDMKKAVPVEQPGKMVPPEERDTEVFGGLNTRNAKGLIKGR